MTMERFAVNGSAAQLAANDVYGVFSTLFRDSYYHAEIGAVDDDRLQQIIGLFGAPWSDEVPIMTVTKTDRPRFIADTEALIPAHNECAYTVNPPRLLALYCVDNQADGGAFFTVASASLTEAIGIEYLPSLRAARFACQMSGDAPSFETTIMRSTPSGEQIIFTTVTAMTGGLAYQLVYPVDAYSAQLLERLSTVVNDPANRCIHHWRKGDLIVIDNMRLMHGREAFAGGERTLRHLRIA